MLKRCFWLRISDFRFGKDIIAVSVTGDVKDYVRSCNTSYDRYPTVCGHFDRSVNRVRISEFQRSLQRVRACSLKRGLLNKPLPVIALYMLAARQYLIKNNVFLFHVIHLCDISLYTSRFGRFLSAAAFFYCVF